MSDESAEGAPVRWGRLEGLEGYLTYMLEDACHNWVYLERGLEVLRAEDPTASIRDISATTIVAYRALASVGTLFGNFSTSDPDQFLAYPVERPGDLSNDLVAAIRALVDIPDPGTLGFKYNDSPMLKELAARAVAAILPSASDTGRSGVD